ncbi:hybrid-cluster NAD(P)-dependent oxidoreductase [Vibrio sp. UCD-FRSSP16_10]|uniref:hybrid-cluster NAD(P)-dependent oxidoreductase n=1 Tax=unclassified Vibrio TaxID=2614977 RepID=UPI0007FCC25E|nr:MULTISPECIES: hybrid-cluster NAD(P)-dependent oxidoreductase [unclassified Vibrio]OBT06612.1 hybrid-cluster NAD(P)-dependent oxidoreductase [Vibrio sp. UCD-FRSSP16_30]OBT12309.1 hybrid-cluster NAD(P)-dependent oxidoreductase [Vibrio sp. UCD-FRSSP16_10]
MQLTCTDIRKDTSDVTTYWFEANSEIDFIPGQFLPLEIDIDGETHQRCYSLASLPGDKQCSLTIKCVAGGLVSNYLAEQFTVGDSLHCGVAAGEFNFNVVSKQPLLMLSAGCGITPVYSMLLARLASDALADIVFIHSASTPMDRIYVAELEALAAKHPNLKLIWSVSREDDQNLYSARLCQELLQSQVTDITSRTILMCGPDAYMESAKTWFDSLGVNPAHVFHEQFNAAIEKSVVGSGDKNHTLTVNGNEVSICADETVLEVLEKEGLPIFAACRAGVCGSCRCKGDKDKLVSSTTGPLSADDIEQGYFLACASQVKDDMFVEIG